MLAREARFGGARPARATVSAQNLSDYRAGAYAAWLREQDRVENVKALSEFAFRLAEAAGGDVSRPAVAIAAGKIMEALEGATFDGEAGEGADVVKISAALAGLSVAESAARRVQIAGQRVALQERTVSLDEQRFQRQTCELFLKWYDDRRAREIADGKGASDVKIDQLRTLMFGAPAGTEIPSVEGCPKGGVGSSSAGEAQP